MKKIILIISFLWSFYQVKSQCGSQVWGCSGSICPVTNTCELVCNGGFENLSAVPPAYGYVCNAYNWNNANTATADVMSSNATNPLVQTPCNGGGYESPHTGICSTANNYAGILTENVSFTGGDWTEYLETQLTNTMTAGKKYIISFYISKAENNTGTMHGLGVYLTPTSVYQSNSSPLTITPATIFTNTTALNNTSGWTRLSFCYTAAGGEQYLTIGRPAGSSYTISPGVFPSGAVCGGFTLYGSLDEGTYHFIDDVSCALFDFDATATPTSVAVCGTVALNATYGCGITPNVPGFSYGWSGPNISNSGIINPTATVNATSNYVLTINVTGDDGNSCYFQDGATVTSSTTTPLVLTPSSASVCPGSTVSISASGCSTYTFLPGGSTSNPTVFTPTANTTYTVNGTTSAGCIMTQTITIYTYTDVISVSSNTTSMCAGLTATLTASGGTSYTWQPGSLSGSTVAVTPGSTTTYTVSGTTTAHSCLKTNTITITINPLPSLTISPSISNTICLNSSLTLTVSGASTYTWLPSNLNTTTITLTPSTATTYTVKGTSSFGCINTQTVYLYVNPQPTINCNTNKPIICQGFSATLTATGANTYTWNPMGTASSSVVVSPTVALTNYTVIGTSVLGCTNSCIVTQSVFLSSTSFFSVTATPSVLCNSPYSTSSTLSATGSPSSYTWIPSGTVSSTSVVAAGGTYSVSSTNTLGCIGMKTVDVFETDKYAAFNSFTVCGIQTIDLSTQLLYPGAGTYSVNGTQISGSSYTFSSTVSSYTIGYNYTAGIYCNNSTTLAITSNTACCTSSLTQITSTLMAGTTYTGSNVINQDITVSGYANHLQDGEFLIAPNVKITVLGNSQLNIEGAHLYACKNGMWNGINVQFDGLLVLNSSGTNSMVTLIEDAKTAVNIESITSAQPNNSATFRSDGTIFNKNNIAVNINTVTLSGGLIMLFKGNVVTCRTLTFTPTSWPTTSTVSPGLRYAASTPSTALAAPYLLQSATPTLCIPPYSTYPSVIGINITNAANGLNDAVRVGESNDPYTPSNDLTDFNLFDNLATCIQANNSNLVSINNVFQNTRRYTTLPPKPKVVGGSAIVAYVNDDYLYKLNLTNSISTYSSSPYVSNRFWDCYRGVEATNVYQFNMERNIFRSAQTTTAGTGFLPGNTGVYLTTNRFTYYTRYNEFTNITNPVNAPIISGSYNLGSGVVTGIYANNFVISNNYIGSQLTTTTTVTNQFVSNAISVTSPVSSSWTAVGSTALLITDNTIDRVYRGISVNTMNSYATSIRSNTIKLVDDGLFVSTQRGIELVNTTNNVIITTNTLSAANTTNTLATLVYLGTNIGTTSPSVTCNDLSSSWQGFEFNSNNKNTYWRGNKMQTHARGMVISSSGTIGVQGSTSNPQDNAWNGTWTGNFGTYINSSDATKSPLWYQTSAPPTPTGNVGLSQQYGAAGTLSLTTGAFSCGGGGGGGGRYANTNPGRSYNNNSIPSNTFKTSEEQTTFSSEEAKYIAAYTQYKMLNLNDSLKNSDSSNINFYNALANTSISKFVEIDKYFYDNLTPSAIALKATVTPTNNVETNFIKYYDLLEKYKYNSFSDNDLTDLTTLTQLCPGIDGPVIYNARSLYNAITKSVIHVNENCDETASTNTRKLTPVTVVSKPNAFSWDLNLFPNPATSELNVSGKNNTETFDIRIMDAIGKEVMRKALQISGFIGKLDLSLPNGIYLVAITNINNETIIKKLVISK